MLRIGIVLLGMLGGLASAAPPQYMNGWEAFEFYREVSTCRTAIVLPGIKSYQDRGIAAQKPAEELRREAIVMLPAMDRVAVAACFCAVNQAAKSSDYHAYYDRDFTARMQTLTDFVEGVCRPAMEAEMAAVEKEGRDALSLK